MMIEKLHKRAKTNEPVDIMKWLNFTTFDITGDLAFDESFHTLENEEYDEWILAIFNMLQVTAIMRTIRAYPIVGVPVGLLLKFMPGLTAAREKLRRQTHHKAIRRMASKTERKDFLR